VGVARLRTSRVLGAAMLVSLAIGACSGAHATPSNPRGTSPAGATATPTQAAATAFPISVGSAGSAATATLAFGGIASLSSGLSYQVVRCQVPSVSGDTITVVGSTADRGISVTVTLAADEVHVSLFAVSGGSLSLRDFVGTGVTGFEAATGATVSGPLTESTPAGTSTGPIGVLTSLSGSVDCAGQQRGTASMTLTGTLPEGALGGEMKSVRVECDTMGSIRSIGVMGIVTVGSSPALAVVTIYDGSFDVDLETSPSYHLAAKGAGTGNLTGANTGTVDGEATGTYLTGGPKQAVDVSGSATCGTMVTYF
jgi:hypothetical protein